MFCSARRNLCHLVALVSSVVFTSQFMNAQQADNDSQSRGEQAVHAVLSHVILDPGTPTPKTGKQLPTDGHWSIGNQAPPVCSQASVKSAQSCLRVIYQVPEAEVSSEWVVLLNEDGSSRIIEQNDDATRYFLQKLSPDEAKSFVLSRKEAKYPPIAAAAHVSGEVKFQVVVGPDGKLAKAILTSGPEMLRGSAVETIKTWTFKPLTIGTRPVPFQTEVTFRFVTSGPPSGSVSTTP